ncbi:hypothetical protein [Salmonella enterica]
MLPAISGVFVTHAATVN